MAPQEQTKRRRGRPRVGRGVRVISVSIERDLLARADALARRLHISRAALIARALRVMLAAYGER
jgi:metal-responsive CopG/Arc/MetJ family transcriptional regulator